MGGRGEGNEKDPCVVLAHAVGFCLANDFQRDGGSHVFSVTLQPMCLHQGSNGGSTNALVEWLFTAKCVIPRGMRECLQTTLLP